MQKDRKNLASWFAHNKVKFCKQLLCQSYKESILHWILCKTTKMILHAARTKWAKSLQFKFKHVPFHCILGDIWKLIQAPQGTHFAFAFVSKLANHFLPAKPISIFKFQKGTHFVFSSKMIQGPQGTHFPFAFESKFANHLFATKSIWVSNSRFRLQKVHILPSILGQCYKDPQMVLKMTTTKRFDWNLQKISGFVIEMNHIKSDYSQKYSFRRRWWVDWEGPRFK